MLLFVLVLSAAVLVLLLDDLALRIEYEYEYRPEGPSTSTKLRDAKLFGRFTETDEASARQYLVAASMANRIYSKPYSRVQKHREQNDGPKPSRIPDFNGCPIPSDLVIVNVIVNTHFVRHMASANRKYVLIACSIFSAATIVLCLAVFSNPLAIAYHEWRMNAEYNTIFGDSQPVENGLASFDVTGVNVDAVMERYFTHRQALVDYGVLRHLSSTFSSLNSDGTEEQSQVRSAFVDRMWSRFPGHGHYYLSGNGSFETWIPVDDEAAWIAFIDDEGIINQRTR